jgi:TRAP-type C4-dicarboxylate transport system permease small subunit
MSITFRDKEGHKITGIGAAILLLVFVLNMFILGYLVMLLSGSLHSGTQQFPAFGFWSSVCLTVLFKVINWKDGPITWGGKA